MAINAGDGILFVDPQTGDVLREGLWKEARTKDIMIMRVDDKEFTELITKCVRQI